MLAKMLVMVMREMMVISDGDIIGHEVCENEG